MCKGQLTCWQQTNVLRRVQDVPHQNMWPGICTQRGCREDDRERGTFSRCKMRCKRNSELENEAERQNELEACLRTSEAGNATAWLPSEADKRRRERENQGQGAADAGHAHVTVSSGRPAPIFPRTVSITAGAKRVKMYQCAETERAQTSRPSPSSSSPHRCILTSHHRRLPRRRRSPPRQHHHHPAVYPPKASQAIALSSSLSFPARNRP